MTVYEWLMSNDGITVEFNKYADDDRTKILEIRMTNAYELPHTLATIKKVFRNNQIPCNDDIMILVLDLMHHDLIKFCNSRC